MQAQVDSNLIEPPRADMSATHRTYLALRKMIVTGVLEPGAKLKIEVLRAQLNIGTTPIREALSLLTSDNLVERLDQRGFRAAPTSRENFEEILALRCNLEDMALRRSIVARNQSWEEAIVLSHHRMTRAVSQSGDTFEDQHKAFHMTLLSNGNAPILLKFCSRLYDLNIRYRFLAARSSDYKGRDVRNEHLTIMDETIAGNADRASAALLGHYRQTGAYLAELLGDAALD